MKDKKLNILEINFSTVWGGLEMQMPIVASGLKNLGHNVTVVCPKDSPSAERAIKLGLKVIYLENRIRYIDFITIWQLKNIIKENKIDIIHSHMAKDLWLIIPAAKMAGCSKIFFTRHIESHYRKKDFLHFFLHRSLTGAIATTQCIKESLLYTTHIPEDRIAVIYYGLDLRKFNSQFFPKNVLHEEYKIPGDYFLMGVVGRLEEEKGQEYLLQAVPLILKRFPKVKFFIVGEETRKSSGGYKNYLESIVQELNLQDNVIFTDFRQDIPAVMNSLDILTLTSSREAFGLVIIEAMAMGKTVIATESQGTKEIINNEFDGFLIPPKNSEILAEKIIEVLSDLELRNKVGSMARKKVEEKFEFNKNIKKLEMLFLNS